MNTRPLLAFGLALMLVSLAAVGCNRGGSSPTATYKAAYEAMKNKDAAAFKKLMTKKDLQDIEDTAKKAGKTSDDMLKDVMNAIPLPKSNDTKDEKIDGDRATLQVKNEKDELETINFVKEDGDWKMK